MNPKQTLPLIIASALCAIVVWSSVNLSHPMLQLPEDLFGLTQPNTEQTARIREHQRKNDTIALAMFGALAMTAGVPVFARKLKLAGKAGAFVVALAGGAGAGWLMGLSGFYCQDWLPITWDTLVRVTVRLVAMLAPWALLAALLTAVFTRSYKKIGTLLVAGLIGSIGAAIGYALITGVLLPGENSDSVLPHGTFSRLFLFGIAPLVIWLTIEHQYHSGGKPEVSSSPVELNVA